MLALFNKMVENERYAPCDMAIYEKYECMLNFLVTYIASFS
jgi:hypothetical protein